MSAATVRRPLGVVAILHRHRPSLESCVGSYMVVFAQPGTLNFQSLGESVALWQDFQQQPQRPTLTPPIVPKHPDLMFTGNEPSFGTAAFISNATLYVYGCGTPDNGSDKGCRLTKVDPAKVQNRNAWTFYTGNGSWCRKTPMQFRCSPAEAS
jgi:hypothetical protein